MFALIKDGNVATVSNFFSPHRLFELTGIRTSVQLGEIGNGFSIVEVADQADDLKPFQYHVEGSVVVTGGKASRNLTATDMDLDQAKDQMLMALGQRRDKWRGLLDYNGTMIPINDWSWEVIELMDGAGKIQDIDGNWIEVEGDDIRAALFSHRSAVVKKYTELAIKIEGYKTVNGIRAFDLDALWPGPAIA